LSFPNRRFTLKNVELLSCCMRYNNSLIYHFHIRKRKEIRNICQVFLLFPILLLINFSMPAFSERTLLSFIFTYTPMITPLTIFAINQPFTYEQLGLNFKDIWHYLSASILTTENTESAEKLCSCSLYLRVFRAFCDLLFRF
jgi:hypothetical protein